LVGRKSLVSVAQITPEQNRFVRTTLQITVSVLLLAGPLPADQDGRPSAPGLKSLSLRELGDIEVTTTSKEPVKLSRTPAAMYVLTQDDIRRSGVTTIPDALRLVPGVEVAQIDSRHYAVGIRGFRSNLSRSVLVLMDGRSVYLGRSGDR
jgi:iron complex outermembrane receptor protein